MTIIYRACDGRWITSPSRKRYWWEHGWDQIFVDLMHDLPTFQVFYLPLQSNLKHTWIRIIADLRFALFSSASKVCFKERNSNNRFVSRRPRVESRIGKNTSKGPNAYISVRTCPYIMCIRNRRVSRRSTSIIYLILL